MKRIHIIISLLLLINISLYAYKYGDVVINADGSKGIVFWSSPDGIGGWMVALDDEPMAQWGDTFDIPGIDNSLIYDTYADTAAYSYTKEIRDFYPAGAYAANVVDFNNGWYLPTLSQLAVLYVNLPKISPIIILNGGTDLLYDVYWSSSEIYNNAAGCFRFIDGKGFIINKSSSYNVRAVRSYINKAFQYDSTLTYLWNTGDTNPQIKVAPTETKDYSVVATNEVGCDAYAETIIFVGENQTDTIYASICDGETYSEYGFNETITGTYYNVVSSPNGCALTIELNLTVNPKKEDVFYDTISVYQEYLNHGFYYPYIDTVGDILDSLTYATSYGCDSLVILNLHVLPVYRGILNDTICQGQTYNKNGFVLPEQDYLGLHSYFLYLKTENGCCDSISELRLKVYPASFSYTDATICEGDSVVFNGEIYKEPGIYAAYLTNSRGCDSIASLRLFRKYMTSSITRDTICEGDSITFNTTVYKIAGTYAKYFNNIVGCDSTAYLELVVNTHSSSVTNITICEGDSINFNGTVYSLAGTYQAKLTNAKQCDSIATLLLKTSRPEPTYLYETIIDGESIHFNDEYLTVDGVYVDTLNSYYNCDSIIVLEIIVIKNVVVPEIFTPNKDGTNDVLIIKNIEQYPNNKVLIFNRWGNKVWEAGPYLNDWDGTNQFGVTVGGNELPVGTYFYILELGDGSDAYKGYIYLNR